MERGRPFTELWAPTVLIGVFRGLPTIAEERISNYELHRHQCCHFMILYIIHLPTSMRGICRGSERPVPSTPSSPATCTRSSGRCTCPSTPPLPPPFGKNMKSLRAMMMMMISPPPCRRQGPVDFPNLLGQGSARRSGWTRKQPPENPGG